jgi:hypothetical protein
LIDCVPWDRRGGRSGELLNRKVRHE